jgi:hypothetical protein
MKMAWIVCLAALVALPAQAAVIAATSAAAHAGQSATVEGQVSEVHAARGGKAQTRPSPQSSSRLA